MIKDIKEEIKKNYFLYTYIFMDFPDVFDKQETEQDNTKLFEKFIHYIELLDEDILEKYHVGGRIYEYFLGFVTAKNKGKRGGSQMEDLGQFFSSRLLIRFIITLLKREKSSFINKK
jgi:hypothetical protein